MTKTRAILLNGMIRQRPEQNRKCQMRGIPGRPRAAPPRRWGHLGVVATVVALGFAGPALTAPAVPSDVLAVVDEINRRLEPMIVANFGSVPPQRQALIDTRRPRHVLMKAREAYDRLQLLRRLYGLPVQSLEPLPAREIQPSDVKSVVDALLAGVVDLSKTFEVSTRLDRPEDPRTATPNDVFAGLSRTVELLNALDVPPVAPNDTHQLVETIIAVLEEIRQVRGVTDSSPAIRRTGTTPAEVYAIGRLILGQLRKLTEANPEFTIPGGVAQPSEPSAEVVPADVVDLFGSVLADVVAIKVTLGVATPTLPAPPSHGRTPSDVFRQAELVLQLAKSLR